MRREPNSSKLNHTELQVVNFLVFKTVLFFLFLQNITAVFNEDIGYF